VQKKQGMEQRDMTQPTRSETTPLRVNLTRRKRVWGANPNKHFSFSRSAENMKNIQMACHLNCLPVSGSLDYGVLGTAFICYFQRVFEVSCDFLPSQNHYIV